MVKVMQVSVFALAAALLLVTMAKIPVADAVTCLPTELATCTAAFTTPSRPTGLCCAKLREQEPCLCGYMENPILRLYLSSENAKKAFTTCGVVFPNC